MASSKSYINLSNKYDRIVLLVDMDCFYCQVEEKLDPSLKGKPLAVVQYNAWRGGGIIAVNYPAREQGVTRYMRGDEAKEQCPDIVLAKVPSVREKADLTKYREAGKDVATILQKFTPLLERASVDEAYLDITEEVVRRLEIMNKGQFQLKPAELNSTYAVGYENIGEYIQEISGRIETDVDDFHCNDDDLTAVKKSDIKLLLGAAIANEIRAKVKEKTGYECSAGIAHNKILAKLACGINKPNKQTILPLRQIQPLFSTLPVGKITGLGGKFGEHLCEMLSIKFMGDLTKFSEAELQRRFDQKNGSWLYHLARGDDLECVTPRFYSKSIGCCKKFPGRNAITGIPTLEHWLGELANEICERMEKDVMENNRRAKQMVVSYIQEISGQDVSSSRSIPLPSYEADEMAKCAIDVMRRNTDQFLKLGSDEVLNNPLKFLGISVGKFETIETNRKNTIEKLFLNHSKKKASEEDSVDQSGVNVKDAVPVEQKSDKKGFFAKYFKKNVPNEEESVTQGAPSVPTMEENKTEETKSFFLRAMKQKQQGENSETEEKTSKAEDTPSACVPDGNEIKSFFSKATKRKNIDELDEPQPNETTTTEITASKKSVLENTQIIDPVPSTSIAPNYTETYAEFLTPQPKDNDFTTCEKCGKKVLSYTFQSHQDFHFALELSQEQREQFRAQVRAKIATTPPSKKVKTSGSPLNSSTRSISASQPTSSESSIIKFLAKEQPAPDDETTAGESSQDSKKCFECGNFIPVEKVTEHMDYHEARKLQLEWNKQVRGMEMKQKSTAVVKSSSAKSGGATSKIKTKNIKTFFATQT